MTISIFQALAVLPSGTLGSPLTHDELSRYLGEHYGTESEKQRNARHCLRDELYRDGGVHHMKNFINRIFTDPTVRDLRQKFVEYARFNNPTKRIVNEVSTVYSEPAKRFVQNDNDAYQALLNLVRMDERAIEIDRLLTLHGALLVGFRVGERPDGTRYPWIDVATPSNVRAVMHPNDDSQVIGWLVRCSYKTARSLGPNTPVWTLWTDYESMYLRDDFTIIGDSVIEHGLGVCPWVPVTLAPPGPGFWPGDYGEDIAAAHVAIWFQNILTLKESKSATKQTIVSGDGTATARGQALDSEVVGELADGQSATTVDMSMDLSMFRDNADHILYNVGYNHGLPPSLLEHQSATSADARELQRIPLKEIRRRRQVPLRIFEESFALVMSVVCAFDLPEYAFDPVGWRLEFMEAETPLNPSDEFDLFLRRRQAGLTSTQRFLMEKSPGMTEDEAQAFIADNVADETERVFLMRDLMAMSGALGANAPVDNRVPVEQQKAPSPVAADAAERNDGSESAA